MNKHVALGMTGFSLIAVTYGMARFSWGIMLPDIRQAIPFTPEVAGIIAACSYVAYCLSVFLASFLTDRFGPRLPAVLAGISAAIGLVILALAYSPLILATGLFIAGLSSGLASPSLAAAVSKRISAERQTQVNTLINAGTSGGSSCRFWCYGLCRATGAWHASSLQSWRYFACLQYCVRCQGNVRNNSDRRRAGALSLRNRGCFACW